MRDLIFEVSIVFLVMFLSVGSLLVANYFIQKNRCIERYEDYFPEFSIFGGCRIEWEGKTTPVENIGFRDFN